MEFAAGQSAPVIKGYSEPLNHCRSISLLRLASAHVVKPLKVGLKDIIILSAKRRLTSLSLSWKSG